MRLKKKIIAGFALLSVGALLAGCAGGSSTTTPTESSGTETPVGGTNYTIAVAPDFQGADRAAYSSEAAKTLADIMQGRLFELETAVGDPLACYADAPAAIKPSSALVESWELADDRLSLDITLRSGVLSAAGNELTAQDVAWTLERIQAIDTTGTTLWFSVGGFDSENPITVHDDYNFTLNLPVENALAPYALAGTAGMIYDSETVKANSTDDDPWGVDWLQDHTANFGPWNLDRFSSQQLVFGQNPNFAGDRSDLETVTIISVPDSSSRIQLLQAGEVQEVNGLDYTQMASLESSGGASIVRCDATARDWFGVNASDPVLGDERVRQAISLALDRDAIAQNVYRGFVTPAKSGLSAAFGVSEGEFYTRDLDRARELLADAGVPEGFSFELSVNPAQPGAYSAELSALIQQQLAEVGINVTITNVPSAVDYRDAGRAQSMQAWLLAESPAFQNAGYSAWLSYGTGGLQNYSGFFNERVDELADQVMTGAASGLDATNELSEITDQFQPAIYLVDRPTLFVRADCVQEVPTSTLMVDYSGAVTTCS